MAGGDGELSGYEGRRDFGRTGEPRGRVRAQDPDEGPVFVVQHHLARADHYDFRLEVDGVLRSWAVPKGVSSDPRDRRLAVPTQDHPLDYADFEGTIAHGEYGGGSVQVWDRGHYTNTTRRDGREPSMAQGLADGHVSVRLNGEKLSGRYALTRFRSGGDEAWLLVKVRDDRAVPHGDATATRTGSVLTGRGTGEIAEDAGRTPRGRPLEDDGHA